jgi:hypothetical protein
MMEDGSWDIEFGSFGLISLSRCQASLCKVNLKSKSLEIVK